VAKIQCMKCGWSGESLLTYDPETEIKVSREKLVEVYGAERAKWLWNDLRPTSVEPAAKGGEDDE